MKNPGFIKFFVTTCCSITLAVLFTFSAIGQTSTIIGIVFQGTDLDEPSESSGLSINPDLNVLLQAYNVSTYQIAYPLAKSKKARNCFEIILQNATDNDYQNLRNDLINLFYSEVLFDKQAESQECPDPEEFNDPCVQGNDGHYLTNGIL